jgi:hypothetical protein
VRSKEAVQKGLSKALAGNTRFLEDSDVDKLLAPQGRGGTAFKTGENYGRSSNRTAREGRKSTVNGVAKKVKVQKVRKKG